MFNRSVNKLVAVGNLGQDVEMKYMPNGNAVCNFSIATTESWKNKQTGEYEKSTEWMNCVVFGKFGEMCGQYLKKGAKVYIEGKLKTEKWNDKTSGQERSATKIIVSELQLMDASTGQGGQQAPQQQQGGFQQQAPAQQQQAPQQNNQSWGNAPQQQQAAPQQQQAPQMAPAYNPAQQQSALNQQQPNPQQQQQSGGQQQAPGKQYTPNR